MFIHVGNLPDWYLSIGLVIVFVMVMSLLFMTRKKKK